MTKRVVCRRSYREFPEGYSAQARRAGISAGRALQQYPDAERDRSNTDEHGF